MLSVGVVLLPGRFQVNDFRLRREIDSSADSMEFKHTKFAGAPVVIACQIWMKPLRNRDTPNVHSLNALQTSLAGFKSLFDRKTGQRYFHVGRSAAPVTASDISMSDAGQAGPVSAVLSYCLTMSSKFRHGKFMFEKG